jgi:hypothetical protein
VKETYAEKRDKGERRQRKRGRKKREKKYIKIERNMI